MCIVHVIGQQRIIPKNAKSKIMKLLLSFLLIILTHWMLPAQDCGQYTNPQYDSITTIPDLYYGSAIDYNGDTVELFLDLYVPAFDTNASRPLLVAVHGGGFYSGNRKSYHITTLCKEFSERGYVTASISYRLGYIRGHDALTSVHPYPFPYDQAELIRAICRSVQDTRGAIRYLKGVANDYNIDTTKVFVGGQSAGGFVALHTAYMKKPSEKPDFAAQQPNANYTNIWGQVIASKARPDLGSIEGDLNLNGTTSDFIGAINIYGGIYDTGLIECNEPNLYQHHILDDPIVACGGAKAYNIIPGITNPLLPNKNPWVYGSCTIKNYIEDSLDCCQLKEWHNILPSNIITGPTPHDYLSPNSINVFFEDAPLAADSTICQAPPLEFVYQDTDISFCEDEPTDLLADAIGCNVQYQWYLNGAPIDNTSNNMYTPTLAGSYQVEATDCNGCLLLSDDIVVDIIPLPEQETILEQQGILSIPSTTGYTYQWLLDGNSIPGATTNSYAPTESGDYSVVVTNPFGCQSQSDSYNFVLTNTITPSQDHFTIYPNPASEWMFIDRIDEAPITFIGIHNLQGKLLASRAGPAARKVDVGKLPTGIYFLKIATKQQTYTTKFLKL